MTSFRGFGETKASGKGELIAVSITRRAERDRALATVPTDDSRSIRLSRERPLYRATATSTAAIGSAGPCTSATGPQPE